MPTRDSFDADEVVYPTRDGRPIGETTCHRENLAESLWTLQAFFKKRRREDVYVSGNMMMYYVPGDPIQFVAPDVFVVFGVPDVIRDCYKTWEEPKQTLDLVIEFTSKRTREEDLIHKFQLYENRLGVHEYLLFDPFAEYLDPPQQLFRLIGKQFTKIEPIDGRLPSQVLELNFDRDGAQLRFWNPVTGAWLPTTDELRESNKQLAAEIDRLKAELEALKHGLGQADGNGGE